MGRMLKQQCRSDWMLHWPEPKFLSLSCGPGANTGANTGASVSTRGMALVIFSIRVIGKVINSLSLCSLFKMIDPTQPTGKIAKKPLLPQIPMALTMMLMMILIWSSAPYDFISFVRSSSGLFYRPSKAVFFALWDCKTVFLMYPCYSVTEMTYYCVSSLYGSSPCHFM